MNEVIIHTDNQINSKRWNEFLIRTCNYNMFTSLEYYNLLKAKYIIITACNEENQLIGGTICRIRGGVFPFSIIAKSFWIESGLLVEKTDCLRENEIKSKLLQSIEKQAREQKCTVIKFNHWCMNENPEVFEKHGFTKTAYSTFISDLALSPEILYSKLDRNTKAAVKKAKKEKLEFCIADKEDFRVIQEFYRLYDSTQKRAANYNRNISMTLKPLGFINGILKDDSLKSYLVYVNVKKILAAGIIIIINGNYLLCYIAASDIELNREYGASSFLFWESMLWAKKEGLKFFDFGGVPNEPNVEDPAYGVYRFKKNFGGNLVQFSTGEKILSSIKAKLLNTALNFRSVIRILMKFSTKF